MPLRHRSRGFSSRSWSTAERFCSYKDNSSSTSFMRYHAAQITNTHRNINALWRSMGLSIVAIGRFLSVRHWVKQSKEQIYITTAELALHYRGLGAGPPTSKVQKVKRLPSLPVSELGIFLLHPKLSILRLTRKEYAIAKSKIIKIAPFVLHPRNLSYLRLARKKCTMDFVN